MRGRRMERRLSNHQGSSLLGNDWIAEE